MTVLSADSRKYFVDVFDNWVANIRKKYDIVDNEQPYSYFGSQQDIVNYLIEKSASPTQSRKKFPFICLVDDFEETINSREHWYTLTPTIYIFAETLETYDPRDRYTNVIKPILYPLFELLLREVECSKSLSPTNEFLSFKKRLYRGQIGENVMVSDTVDALKITFTNLKIKKHC